MTRILITGASKGIGRATALELVRRGHEVVATARDPRSLDDLDVAARLRLDVTDQASVAAAVAAAGEVDVLLSNAGAIFLSPVERIPLEHYARLLEQNTVGSLRVAQALLPTMRERGRGRLLFTSSVVGRIVLPGNAAYASTKWALEALAEGLAMEVAPFGLEVGLLEPGAVASGALDAPTSYYEADDAYSARGEDDDIRTVMLSVEDVAVATADALEAEHLPLRVPIGEMARGVLAARRLAPDDVPFVIAG